MSIALPRDRMPMPEKLAVRSRSGPTSRDIPPKLHATRPG